MAGKIYSINLNIPTEEIPFQLLQKQPDAKQVAEHKELLNEWSKKDPKTRGPQPQMKTVTLDGPEFVKQMVMSAISQCHQSGTTKVLRRTKDISEKFQVAIVKGTTIELLADDYNFIKECITKADKWTNDEGIARAVLLVEDAILGAEVLEGKPQEV